MRRASKFAPSRVLLVLLLAAAPAARSEVLVAETRETYPIGGDTPKAFRAEVAEQIRGRRTHGLDAGSIESTYRLWPVSDDHCEVEQIEVTAHLHWSLPVWNAPADADPAMVAAVDATFEELERHGAEHRTQALAAAARLDADLRALGHAQSCRATRTLAERLRRRAMVELRQAGHRLDEASHRRVALFEVSKRAVPVDDDEPRHPEARGTLRAGDYRLPVKPH